MFPHSSLSAAPQHAYAETALLSARKLDKAVNSEFLHHRTRISVLISAKLAAGGAV